MPEGVVFTIEALSAERVQLVGDFNGWTMEGSEMQHDGRFWRKVLNLEPGATCIGSLWTAIGRAIR